MSMTAEFVQVSAGQLTGLVEDPESIESWFAPDAAPPQPMGRKLSEAQRQRVIEQGPQMFETVLARLDPKTRELLSTRLEKLGLDAAGLKKREAGEALLNLMMSRAGQLAGGSGGTSGRGASPSRGARLSIDKSWHGIHYLLCGAPEPGSSLISQVVLGGTDVGDDFSGYGSARYFAVNETAAIASALNRANLEAEMVGRYDPAQMTKAGIYPNAWSAGDLQWLMDEFRQLRDFYTSASAGDLAVVTCLI